MRSRCVPQARFSRHGHLDWAFPRLFLQRRGVDDRIIGWIMQIVMTENTTININGEGGPYFRSSYGVREGGPISPYSLTLQLMPLHIS
jgi:hypothetical protein